MTTVRTNRAWLFALSALVVGCTASEPSTQVVTGKVSAKHNAVGVRAVSGEDVLTAAAVRADGTFTLVLPKGHEYRLELLLRSGSVKHFSTKTTAGKLTGLAFKVCEPQDPWDMGGTDPGTPGMCTDPTDPNCKPPCDPMSGEMCPEPPPPPPCPPDDPNCQPLGCAPTRRTRTASRRAIR
jgi:hypothetical protein